MISKCIGPENDIILKKAINSAGIGNLGFCPKMGCYRGEYPHKFGRRRQFALVRQH
jgi:hypothetical protein